MQALMEERNKLLHQVAGLQAQLAATQSFPVCALTALPQLNPGAMFFDQPSAMSSTLDPLAWLATQAANQGIASPDLSLL